MGKAEKYKEKIDEIFSEAEKLCNGIDPAHHATIMRNVYFKFADKKKVNKNTGKQKRFNAEKEIDKVLDENIKVVENKIKNLTSEEVKEEVKSKGDIAEEEYRKMQKSE